MLNLTDITYSQKGHNKFYQIQMLQQDDDKFFIWTKWGRVGAKNPGTNLEPCMSRKEAISVFKKKFKAKTKNDFDQIHNFVKHPGKYQIVDIKSKSRHIQDTVRIENKRRQLVARAKEQFSPTVPEYIVHLMELIWDFDRMQKTMKELNIDFEKCPLGQLTSVQISKGYRLLRQIQNVLATHNKEREIIELSNEFYTQIPQSFGMKRPPLINHMLRLKEKIALLDILKELEVANTLSLKSMKGLRTNHPADVYYQQLNCELLPVDSRVAEELKDMMMATHSPEHDFGMELLEVYEVQRLNEATRFWPFTKLPNRRLLWHGSRVTNFVGILNQGLKVAPKDAPSTGYMFGKGIYFADLASKSAQYCFASSENPTGILLLCEVALGN